MSSRYLSRITALLLLAFTLTAAPAFAGFKVTVTKSKDFDLNKVSKVAIVTTQCHEAMDCANLERRVAKELGQIKSVTFQVVPEALQRDFLFSQGATEYSPELRRALADHFKVDVFMELTVPFAEKGDGFGGRQPSKVKVELRLTGLEGNILLFGVGTGRPLNVVTSPERVAGNVVEAIVKDAFR